MNSIFLPFRLFFDWIAQTSVFQFLDEHRWQGLLYFILLATLWRLTVFVRRGELDEWRTLLIEGRLAAFAVISMYISDLIRGESSIYGFTVLEGFAQTSLVASLFITVLAFCGAVAAYAWVFLFAVESEEDKNLWTTAT